MTADAATDPARQRRRSIGVAALAAVCVVVGTLAIGFTYQDQVKGQQPVATTATGEGIVPMTDVTTKTEGVPKEPGTFNRSSREK